MQLLPDIKELHHNFTQNKSEKKKPVYYAFVFPTRIRKAQYAVLFVKLYFFLGKFSEIYTQKFYCKILFSVLN